MPLASSISTRHPLAARLSEAAEEFVGVKWVAQGASSHGVDCVGFIAALAFRLNIYGQEEVELPRWGQMPDNNVLLRTFERYLIRVPSPCLGCAALFTQRTYGIKQLYHAGVIGDKYFYEASLPHKGVTRVTISDTALDDARAFFVFQKPGTPLELEYI